jgi:tRNA uridine 5-carbamoylmethylation protein Kti12
MEKMIMLVGPPCSGKDLFIETYFNFLAYDSREVNCVISLDDIIEDIAFDLDATYTEVFPVVAKLAEKKLNRDITKIFNNSYNLIDTVIWNQTNLSDKSRISKLSKVPEDLKKICMVMKWPELSVLLERNDIRFKNTGKNIPPHIINNMINSYVKPTLDEGWDEIYSVDIKLENGVYTNSIDLIASKLA